MNKSQLKQLIREEIKALDEIGMFHDPIGYKKSEPKPSVFTKKYVNKDAYDILKNGKKLLSFFGSEGEANAYINKRNRELIKTRQESVNEVVKQGKRYGDWVVTRYEPVEYDDYGAPKGGRIKLVNQKTFDDLLIQNTLVLGGDMWFVSVNRKTIKNKNPEKVIQQAIKNSINESERQLRDPKKEMLVVKDGKVIVIDKEDFDKYKRKGWLTAEGVK